ncbi:hypothetical protein B7463_g11699, partial [Scytalidium lignicola]
MQSIAPAPMQNKQEMSADNVAFALSASDLRAQLAAVINTGASASAPQPSHGYNDVQPSNSASPRDHNIDPSIGGGHGGMMNTGGDSGGDDSMGDGRKAGKRELSQSKRAAQNRAAQRAFRQRKEGYIKKLEEQVREMNALEDNYKAIQTENYSLREYIIHLQSRLIESQGEYPQPPPNINLSHPQNATARQDAQAHGMEHHLQQRHDGSSGIAPLAPMSSLQASAARTLAAAGLSSGGKHGDEVVRQLQQAEGLQASM